MPTLHFIQEVWASVDFDIWGGTLVSIPVSQGRTVCITKWENINYYFRELYFGIDKINAAPILHFKTKEYFIFFFYKNRRVWVMLRLVISAVRLPGHKSWVSPLLVCDILGRSWDLWASISSSVQWE